MTELTPRNNFPYPSEREEPFYDSFKSGELAKDAAVYANSDNSNVQFVGGGIFSWDATSDFLFWTDTIQVNGWHSPFGGSIPSGSIFVQQDEVVFFTLPRLVQTADTTLQLYKSNQLFQEGVRLHDLKLFVGTPFELRFPRNSFIALLPGSVLDEQFLSFFHFTIREE